MVFFASLLSLLLSTGEANCTETEDHTRHWFGEPHFALYLGAFVVNSRLSYWAHRPPSQEMHYSRDGDYTFFGMRSAVCMGLIHCVVAAGYADSKAPLKLYCEKAR
jgi:hypothetical protein